HHLRYRREVGPEEDVESGHTEEGEEHRPSRIEDLARERATRRPGDGQQGQRVEQEICEANEADEAPRGIEEQRRDDASEEVSDEEEDAERRGGEDQQHHAGERHGAKEK